MAERSFRCTHPVGRIAELLEIQHRQRRGGSRELLDQGSDRFIADAAGEVRFEIVPAAADEGFVEKGLDLVGSVVVQLYRDNRRAETG